MELPSEPQPFKYEDIEVVGICEDFDIYLDTQSVLFYHIALALVFGKRMTSFYLRE